MREINILVFLYPQNEVSFTYRILIVEEEFFFVILLRQKKASTFNDNSLFTVCLQCSTIRFMNYIYTLIPRVKLIIFFFYHYAEIFIAHVALIEPR